MRSARLHWLRTRQVWANRAARVGDWASSRTSICFDPCEEVAALAITESACTLSYLGPSY